MSKNPQALPIIRRPKTTAEVFPNHYQALLGDRRWQAIHPAIRQRFSGDQSACYTGTMNEVFLSGPGIIFAQLCRLIGSPLAHYRGTEVPTEVRVFYDAERGGFCWDRQYFFPQGLSRVRSTKCVMGELGLVEILGHGFGMQLKVSEDQGALMFKSVGYFWQWGKRRFALPKFLWPGQTTVRQSALDGDRFRFELSLRHPLLGLLAQQCGDFNPH